MSTAAEQITQLELTISQLETQRAALGDTVVNTALKPLREQLDRLRAAETTSSPPQLDGERKLVTVMFADISGFTALAETTDPEAVRDLINACFERLVPVVHKYEGTVDKFIGDGIMALFGAPVAHENDAERALRAALDMVCELDAFDAERGAELGVHFGINTGLVIAGGIGTSGRQEYSVMGDAVNLAARLEDASECGQILVGPDTFRMAAPLFEFESLDPIRVKGKGEPVTVHRLTGVKVRPGLMRGIVGLSSPLVGRDREVGQLTSALTSLRRGEGGVIALVAEAGLGKSRSIAEVRKTHAEALDWAEGRALSYTQGISYGVARDALYSLFSAGPDRPPEMVNAALRGSVEYSFPDQAPAIYPYLASMLNLPLDEDMAERVKYLQPDALQGQMLRAYREYVRVRAVRKPLVLVWEDLHWSDPSSLRLLEALLPLAAEAPVLFLLVFRPVKEERTWEFHQKCIESLGERYQVMELAPLDRKDSAQLVGNLLRVENLPKETHRLILDKAEGNPFFIEELLRSLIDAGLVAMREGQVMATQSIENLEVPNTLSGVIAARIDRLPPEDKHTLQAASVIGRVFQRQVLSYVLDQPSASPALEASLSELQRRELIRQRKDEANLADLEYIFKHAVTQEVTYNSLLMARRRELHRVAGEAIEALFPDHLDELSATLAYHFERAEVRDKAVRYMIKAADHARETYANDEAIALYRSAIGQISRLPKAERQSRASRETVLRLRENMGSVLQLSGQADQARVAYQEAIDTAPEADRARRARLLRRQAEAWAMQRKTDEALSAYERAESALGPEKERVTAAWRQEWIDIQLARLWTLYLSGRVADMNMLVERAGPVIERHGSPSQQGLFYNRLGLLDLRRFRYYMLPKESLEKARKYLVLSREVGNLITIANAQMLLAFVHLWRNELDEAEKQFMIGLPIAERAGDMEDQMLDTTYLAVVARKRGQNAETKRWASQALAIATATKAAWYIAVARINLAWVAWRGGDVAKAEDELQAGLAMLPSVYPLQWMARWPLAAIAVEEDRVAEAIEHAQALLQPVQQRLPEEIAAILEQAIQTWEQGEQGAARDHLLHALELVRETGNL